MLTRLHISNYALIDELEIKFDNGLTIITGETGAGKSIILGALSLILGERAEARSVRNPEKKVVVGHHSTSLPMRWKVFSQRMKLTFGKKSASCVVKLAQQDVRVPLSTTRL